MMIPEIKIRYSWIYDSKWREIYKLRKGKEVYPKWERVARYSREIKNPWKRIEKRVLRGISKISGLKWKEKEIIVYVVGRCRPFSIPLTIPMKEDKKDFIDILVHELIHNIFTQNRKIFERYRRYANKKYKKLDMSTLNHIPLFAIHKKILLESFSKKRVEKELEKAGKSKHPEYKKAWDIVEKEGYKEIIEEFWKRAEIR